MDPLLIVITPQLVVTPKNRFLARVILQAVSLHSREINSHRVLVAPRRGPVVLA